MKLIQRLGAVGLVLVLLLTLGPTPVFAAGSYIPIQDYTEASGLDVETEDKYRWTYDTSTGYLSPGNLNISAGQETFSQIKVTAAKDGYLKFDYAMPFEGDVAILAWRNKEFAKASNVILASNQQSGKGNAAFYPGEIRVSAGDTVYFAYLRQEESDGSDYCQLRNIRLVTDGTLTVYSSDEALGTVSTNPKNLTELPANTPVALTATEIDGKFDGWYETVGNVTKRLSGEKEFTYAVSGDAIIEGRFVPIAKNAVATVNGVAFDSLSAALANAQSTATAENNIIVKLVQDVEITENLTIPAYVTLLVPYDTNDMGIDPEMTTPDDYRQKGNVYRKLTVAAGYTVTVNGTLLVNASLGSSDYGHQGSLGGDYGALELNGPLVVNKGGALKVRGMLTGTGSVTAKSGGEVWQAFEMTDWPGGSEAFAMNGRKEFPISQYYFQRIQVPTTLEYGSSMGVFAYVYVPTEGNAMQAAVRNLIGPTEDSFFKMNEGSKVTLGYRKDTYTTDFYIEGSVEIRSLTLKVGQYTLGTDSSVFPIPASFAITVKENANCLITQDLKLMTGTVLKIESGATVTVDEGAKMYLYGAANYDQPRWVPSSSDVSEPLTPEMDAYIMNSGTLIIKGEVHTSTPDTTQIKNDGTVEGWDKVIEGTVGKVLISYDASGGRNTMESHYIEPGEIASLLPNTFVRDGYYFQGWTSDPSGQWNPFTEDESLIPDKLELNPVPELKTHKLTLYAVWKAEEINDSSVYAAWKIGGKPYTGETAFSDALSDAAKSGATVVLGKSGILPAGNYIIPSNVKVLLPHDSGEVYEEDPYSTRSYIKPSNPYRYLEMRSGAHITVYGQLNVSSLMYSGGAGSNNCGSPTGNSAQIRMKENSTITVENGGTLFAYGFITGAQGKVTANSGSTIHELFQLCEHRGGRAMSGMLSGTFPITQYYMQNIEAEITYMEGCKEILHTDLYVEGSNPCHDISFLGSNSGLFQMGNNSKLVRSYDPNTDRITMDVHGDVTFASTSLVVMDQEINTVNYTLPLTNNYTINIHSGTTTIRNNTELLPGVKITVDKGATLAVDKQLWVYDSDEWIGKNYVYENRDLISVPYSPSKNYTRKSSDLTDASINVNGRLQVNGNLFTTAGGAHIFTSEGSGEVYLKRNVNLSGSITDNTIRYTGLKTTDDVPAGKVKLHNADMSGEMVSVEEMEYTETEGCPDGTTFTWCFDHKCWEGKKVTVTFYANGGNGAQSVEMHSPGRLPAQAEKITRTNLDLKGWSTAADGSGKFLEDNGIMALYNNTTLYAQWHGKVTWLDGNGKELYNEYVDYGVVPAYTGAEPAKTSTAKYHFHFANSWSKAPYVEDQKNDVLTAIPAFTGHITYYAVFDPELRAYTITWKNYNGTVLKTDTLFYGEMPQYEGTPTNNNQSGDGVSSSTYFVFDRWNPAVESVTGGRDYIAVYNEVTVYRVRFYDYDGKLLSEVSANKGQFPVIPQPPERMGYEFVGWATEKNGTPLESIVGTMAPADYYAVYEKTSSDAERISGDVNGDNTVNVNDLTMLLDNFGAVGENVPGDVNNDSIVNVNDLTILLDNFGLTRIPN